ncbi:hypothetical protein [Victivallis sp. Marseille-Q1083]|uniref:hypothetical protein n=1 Tax=Victivallis sp. Marseille-Q1083 TaxID=2717288 RepID=UPI00158C6759|nr:hypothetical protein [Victivallis sp. Marseille-Q1083]
MRHNSVIPLILYAAAIVIGGAAMLGICRYCEPLVPGPAVEEAVTGGNQLEVAGTGEPLRPGLLHSYLPSLRPAVRLSDFHGSLFKLSDPFLFYLTFSALLIFSFFSFSLAASGRHRPPSEAMRYVVSLHKCIPVRAGPGSC